MPTYTIDDLVSAYGGEPLMQWREAVPQVDARREAVERFLADGGHAYGFSTFLGHLDRYPVDGSQSEQIFEAHLVGTPELVDAGAVRAMTVLKLCHLSQAASGISGKAYRALLERRREVGDRLIDLDASYGSGDVVCASWWTRAVLGASPPFEQGDVIALINGNFVVPGLVLHSRAELRQTVGRALALIEGGVARIEKVPGVQLPVSARDPKPLTAQLARALAAVDEALVASANGPSGNPLFVSRDGGIVAESNSSFLDFGLSSALVVLSEALKILSAYVRSVTLSLARQAEEGQDSPLHGAQFVQLPKVSKAYLDQVLALLGASVGYGQTESDGVEDIGDAALLRCHQVRRALPLLGKQLALLDAVGTDDHPGREHAFPT